MTDEETRAALAEAEQARHKLILGRSAVEIETDGDRVRYARADLPSLNAYIRTLKRNLGEVPRAARVQF